MRRAAARGIFQGVVVSLMAAVLGPVFGDSAVDSYSLAAQTLQGTVIRADGVPLPGADVVVRSEGGAVVARASSDASGRFLLALDDVEGAGLRLEASLLGYASWETASFEVDADAELEILVRMQVSAIPLAPVTVEARPGRSTRRLADFERRMENPTFGGYFITGEDIARRRASRPSNLPLAAPGMTVRPVPGPFDRWQVYTGDCPATLFVDGVRIDQTVTSVDEYLTMDRIAGVEVYPRSMSVPPQYQDAPARECGVVLYWTKELEPDRQGGWSATKIAVGVGLLTSLLALGLVL